MKKIFSFIVIFLLFIFIYQFIVIFFTDNHEVTYELEESNQLFKINEKYRKKNNEDGYSINITTNNSYKYTYYIDNKYNKQKGIIKKIKYYKKDNYICIYPITNLEKEDFEIECSDGKEIYSYNYVNELIDLNEFIKQLKLEEKYQEGTKETLEDNKVYFYKNNFYDNEYLALYRYKYLMTYNKEKINKYDFSEKDIYYNELGVYIKNRFVVPMNESSKEIKRFLVVDYKNHQKEYVYLDEPISKNIYNIGIVDKKLYIFDLDNKKEYSINSVGLAEEIGNKEEGFIFYEDGKWKEKSITYFTKDKITIKDELQNTNLKYEYDYIYTTKNAYYIIEDNKMYKIYKNNQDIKILLLELNKYSNIQVENDRIYYIDDSYLYRYDQYGKKILVNNNEFKYNSTNIYHIYNE